MAIRSGGQLSFDTSACSAPRGPLCPVSDPTVDRELVLDGEAARHGARAADDRSTLVSEHHAPGGEPASRDVRDRASRSPRA